MVGGVAVGDCWVLDGKEVESDCVGRVGFDGSVVLLGVGGTVFV